MAAVLAAPSLYRYTGGEPPSVDDLTRRYGIQTRGASADGSERWLNQIITLDTRPIGYVQATIPVDAGPTEIAWVVGEPWQGHGYATRAARLLLRTLAGQGITRVIAHIHPEHAASRRIAEHLGLSATDQVVDGRSVGRAISAEA